MAIPVSKAMSLAVVNTIQPTGFALSFFKGVTGGDTRFIDVSSDLEGATVAEFVNPEAVATGTESLDFTTKAFVVPTMQNLMTITPKDIENILITDNEFTPRSHAEKLNVAIGQKTVKQKARFARKMELMAIEALQFGRITVIGEGENRIIDFGVPASQTLDIGAVDPTIYFNGANADPDQLFTNMIELAGTAGSVITHVFGRPDVVKYILRDDIISKNLDNRRKEIGSQEFRNTLKEDGVIYHGHYKEIAIFSGSGNYKDKNGVPQKGVAGKRLTWVAEANQNEKFYGSYPDLAPLVDPNALAMTEVDSFKYRQRLAVVGKSIQLDADQTKMPLLKDVKSTFNSIVLP